MCSLGENLYYPLGRNANYAVDRIGEFSGLLDRLSKDGNPGALEIASAKIMSSLLMMRDDAKRLDNLAPAELLDSAARALDQKDYKAFFSASQLFVALHIKFH